MRKTVLLLLSVVLGIAIMIMPLCSVADSEKAINWGMDKNGVLTFSGEGIIKARSWSVMNPYDVKEIRIGDGITTIEGDTFSDCFHVKTVSLGKDVQLDNYAFGHLVPKEIQTVVLNGTKEFNAKAFCGGSVRNVVLNGDCPFKTEKDLLLSEDGKTVLFYFGSAKNLVIPEGIETIGAGAFYFSTVNQVVFPKSLKKIEEHAFYGSFYLTGISFLGESVDLSGSRQAFSDCSQLKTVSLPSSETISSSMFLRDTSLTDVMISEGTKIIEKEAFNGCGCLESVFIPNSVTEIDETAFPFGSAQFIIKCNEGSYAEKIAKEKGVACQLVKSVESIVLTEETLTLNKGKAGTLKAEVSPQDATNRKIEWVSSDETVATVKDGKIQAKGIGVCDIICKATDGGGARSVCRVSVIQMVQSFQIKEKKLSLPYGGTHKTEVTFKPGDATNTVLEWTASDNSICTVDKDGTVTAVGAGDCEITASTTDGSQKTVKISVHVSVFEAPELNIDVTEKGEMVIPIGCHGIEVTDIAVKTSKNTFFTGHLDTDGFHITPTARGNASVTLTNQKNKKDTLKLNIRVTEEAISAGNPD